MPVNIAAIILAAGRSQRMGTQKLLLPWAKQTVIGHIADQIIAAGINKIVAVVGADRDAVTDALAGRDLILVENPNPDGDMLSSIRCGLQALSPECSAALIALGDQPGIQADFVSQLLRFYGDSNGAIVAPIAAGKRGHPVILPSRYFAEVLEHFDGVGLQGLLQVHSHDVRLLAVSNASELADMDYPQDYERFRRDLKG
ncbi:MAG TPA: nucleotidyltransferase family protein [Pirellulales bacterium]|jgi:molybdenum cofactor cytidylyltransferase|nr:nucleotidyltransferase family protein [Pirellulales bacterium]